MPQPTNRWRAALALALPLTLLASACAQDDDGDSAGGGGGGEDTGIVTIYGPEVEQEAENYLASFEPFEEETGIDVQYQGDRSFEEQIGVRVDGGDPPDIGMFPQPGKVQDFSDDLVPLPDDIASMVEENFNEGWTDLIRIDDQFMAVPAKADLKSLVWYDPAAFEENGYEIPETFAEFEDLIDTMIEDGNTAFCIGIGSDAATGWPFTDWMEDYMLRLKGPEVYDQWRDHEIPFDDPEVVEVGEYVYDLWSREGAVFGGTEAIAATPFAEAGLPLLDGDCMMHRQANFYEALWGDDVETGPQGDVDAFYLPGSEEFGDTVLTGGIYAAAFSDRPEVMQVMEYIASTEYADARAPQGGALLPHDGVDTGNYETELEQNFADILAEADPVRFDASDIMPGAVGAGSFWTAAVDITTGAKTVEEAFADVEDSWPSD